MDEVPASDLKNTDEHSVEPSPAESGEVARGELHSAGSRSSISSLRDCLMILQTGDSAQFPHVIEWVNADRAKEDLSRILIEAKKYLRHEFICKIAAARIDVQTCDLQTARVIASSANTTGNSDLAYQAYSRILQLTPENIDAHRRRLMAAVRLRDEDKQAFCKDEFVRLVFGEKLQPVIAVDKVLSAMRVQEAELKIIKSNVVLGIEAVKKAIKELPSELPAQFKLECYRFVLNAVANLGSEQIREFVLSDAAMRDISGSVAKDIMQALFEDREVLERYLAALAEISEAIRRKSGKFDHWKNFAHIFEAAAYANGEFDLLKHLNVTLRVRGATSLSDRFLSSFLDEPSELVRDKVSLPIPLKGIREWTNYAISSLDIPSFRGVLTATELNLSLCIELIGALAEKDALDHVTHGFQIIFSKHKGALKEATLYLFLQKLSARWRPDLAALLWDSVVNTPLASERVTYLCADALSYVGRTERSREIARNIAQSNPFNTRAVNLLQALNDRAYALECLRRHTNQLQEANGVLAPKALINAVNALVVLGEIAAAKRMLMEALPASAPRMRIVKGVAAVDSAVSADVLFWIARTNELEEKFSAALEFFYKLKLLEGNSARVIGGLLRCFYELGNYTRNFQLLAQLQPPKSDGTRVFSPDLYHSFLSLGRIGDALALYKNRNLSSTLRASVGAEKYPPANVLSGDVETLLLIAEYGPGDEIRFGSIYGEIQERSARVTISCDPRLQSLLSRSFPAIRFMPVNRFRPELRAEYPGAIFTGRETVGSLELARNCDDSIVKEFDTHQRVAFVLDVLPELRSSLEAFPRQLGYLKPEPSLKEKWKAKLEQELAGKIRVGLAWRSFLMSAQRSRHYSNLADWEKLFNNEKVAIVSLQAGLTNEERDFAKRKGWQLHEFSEIDLKDDFEGSAALVAALDCVVSPATTMVEFAGALGVPTVLVSSSEQTVWRRQPDGRDIWHGNVHVEIIKPTESYDVIVDRIAHQFFGEATQEAPIAIALAGTDSLEAPEMTQVPDGQANAGKKKPSKGKLPRQNPNRVPKAADI